MRLDTLALVCIAAYTIVTVITLACAPRQDNERRSLVLAFLGTVLGYVAESPWLFLAGWAISSLPAWRERKVLPLSTLLLGAAFLLPGQMAGFVAIALAVLLRKGAFPFHFWVCHAMDKGPLAYWNLLLNGHLGAYALLRFGFPMFPEAANASLWLLGGVAISNTLYPAVLALGAARPRRILALFCISQQFFILAGLVSHHIEGIAGGLTHLWVTGLSTTALIGCYRALEARSSEVESPRGFLGYGYHAPRLAVLFAGAALAFVGLPGTLGFAAEDLLFQGALETYPLLGVGLPLVTALNAITVLRLMGTLFLGKRGIHVPEIPDARPRERWALTIPVVLLVAGGIAPGFAVELFTQPAQWVSDILR